MTESADHYKTLGIERTAKADQIRAAYRKAASAAHPDRAGGSHEAMAAVTKAFEVLSNPRKREAYDLLGESDEKPVEQQAEAMLTDIISQVINAQRPDVLRTAQSAINEMMREADQHMQTQLQRRNWLTQQQGKTRTKRNYDAVRVVLERDITDAKRRVLQIERARAVMVEALRILGEYEAAPAQPAMDPASQLQSLQANHQFSMLERLRGAA